ncbi:hypothetical protein CC78DRAFT_570459 [Lojkania enalia]|uniref:Uncharacterized protein n=1 Tax=Lojkania enalia TaxID=147567 RepID=A0A9P4K419_9PLEO|nr:hypothetical protein CC78DRAFT_570459 [Didymosphaeria enalia]
MTEPLAVIFLWTQIVAPKYMGLLIASSFTTLVLQRTNNCSRAKPKSTVALLLHNLDSSKLYLYIRARRPHTETTPLLRRVRLRRYRGLRRLFLRLHNGRSIAYNSCLRVVPPQHSFSIAHSTLAGRPPPVSSSHRRHTRAPQPPLP